MVDASTVLVVSELLVQLSQLLVQFGLGIAEFLLYFLHPRHQRLTVVLHRLARRPVSGHTNR